MHQQAFAHVRTPVVVGATHGHDAVGSGLPRLAIPDVPSRHRRVEARRGLALGLEHRGAVRVRRGGALRAMGAARRHVRSSEYTHVVNGQAQRLRCVLALVPGHDLVAQRAGLSSRQDPVDLGQGLDRYPLNS